MYSGIMTEKIKETHPRILSSSKKSGRGFLKFLDRNKSHIKDQKSYLSTSTLENINALNILRK